MDFVRLESIFPDKICRTVDELSKVYDNNSLLMKAISSVGKGILDSDKISGKKILLKPNWVTHNRKNEDTICLRTNDSFLLAALEILLKQKPASITIGDAPIQGCRWELMLSTKLLTNIESLGAKYSIPIAIKDFRRATFDPTENNPSKNRKPLSDYIIFDLGSESFLEQISSNKSNFRVTSYNPDRLSLSHRKGVHKYCITKELFEADIVISIPKIKTHQKTGITGALKNLVGVNGDKDFLPHHRVGGVGFGGDCYPGKNVFRRISEYTLDNANRIQGKKLYWFWFYLSLALWKISNPKNVHHLAAGWFGNDTTWRMVMDINKIAIYGKQDGSISTDPQRVIYSLCDGIIGGQGNGPLDPEPLPLGVISFSNNSSITDICMAILMKFDIQKIALLRSAFNQIKGQEINILFNSNKIDLSLLEEYSIPTSPPPGWVGYL